MAEQLPWAVSGEPKRFGRAGMVIDLRRCVGCHACSVSCKTEHDVALGIFRTRVRYLEKPGATQLAFLPMLCMHCKDAPCIPACPTEAIGKAVDGRVLVDEDVCGGNGECVGACPYGAIELDPQTQIADKCDLCQHRTEVGLDPACVASCPTGTLRFGDLDDPEDEVMQLAKAQHARAFKPEAETNPSVLYIGLERWMEEKIQRGVQLHPDDDDVVYVQK